MKIRTKFNCGDFVSEKVTGYIGIIMGITYYSTGCVHYGLQPRELNKDGVPNDWQWFDESRLQLLEKDKVSFDREEDTSGVFPNAPTM